ncbi:MAG: AAC(3) family N-acetyltransferase [Butyrivibrio sp.]|uniref:AAC(3) family N-acetyltransferase n=1 Tax=Butyrivibrio sp. TaxID=28121 RepID=UPI0025C40117|nr:AAC(3) family N-acetyltransferase [Butyrivibrio sp.]MBQ6587221.1 AAC(3) family N-acetyltransferase [Butyrivibrio sp.]
MNKVFEYIPSLEIAIRCTLHKFPGIKKKALKLMKKQNDSGQKPTKENWEAVKKYLNELDVHDGDILLVHSSMDGLNSCDVTSKEILDTLEGMVGGTGTLVFAAYPECKYDEKLGGYYYDPKRTIAWTGMLPNVFIRRKGVVRSEFPLQTLAAKGKHAEAMMANNIDAVVAQGPKTAWEYCVDHNVKILYFGIEACQCCTMMNYPEDVLGPDEWPIKDWYYEQTYYIKTAEGVVKKEVLHRDDEFYRFYRMAYSERWLKKNGFLTAAYPGGVYIGFTRNGGDLGRRLVEEARNGRLLYMIPKRYWRKRRRGSGCF